MKEPTEVLLLKAHQTGLKTQKTSAEEKQRNCEERIPALESQHKQKLEKVDLLKKKCFRGELTPDEIAPDVLEIENLERELKGEEETHRIASEVLEDIERELAEIERKISHALTRFCQGERARVAEGLSNDKKIREKLLTAYSAMVVGGSYSINWGGFLAAIFAEPGRSEIDKAIGEFRSNYGLDKR